MIVDYKDLINRLNKETYWLGSGEPYSRDIHPVICDEAIVAIAKLLERAENAEKERDAAICDMEALMWHSGDGCEICEYKIVEQRHPYTKLGCRLGSGCECNPKWCGPDKEE